MNFVKMFNVLDEENPNACDSISDGNVTLEHEYTTERPPMESWNNELKRLATTPVLYNLDGYISPYPAANWGSVSPILSSLTEESNLPLIDNKIDVNKIFNANTSALRTLAADQNKATKLFEKKFFEGLMERGKTGLNENDIMAMQALTAARGAVTAIQKEQIGVKKNIADLKIKQQQNATHSTTTGGSTMGGGHQLGSGDIGRSILDNIFNTPVNPTNMPGDNNNISYETADLNSASDLIDNVANSAYTEGVVEKNDYLQFENSNPKTYVVVSDNPNDTATEYATYSSEGELIPDYPNPTTTITSVNRDSMTATDELLIEYPIKIEDK